MKIDPESVLTPDQQSKLQADIDLWQTLCAELGVPMPPLGQSISLNAGQAAVWRKAIAAASLLILVREHKTTCDNPGCQVSTMALLSVYELLVGRKATLAEGLEFA